MVNRLQPNEQATIAVTAKQHKEGEVCFPLTLSVSASLSYQVYLKAKFVVPDLQISVERLEFGGVRRGVTLGPP